MDKILKCILMASAVVIAAGVIPPWLARGSHYKGSKKYACKWKEQLETCHSLDKASELFTCYRIGTTPEGRIQYIPDVKPTEARPLALIQSFADGSWIVCVHAPSHGPRSGPGAGTAVAKDSRGRVTAYFGHICDRIWVSGATLEAFYLALEEAYSFRTIKYNE